MKNAEKKIWLAILIFFVILKSASAQIKLTLDDAKKMALVRNNRLKIAQQNIEAAQASKAVSKASQFPVISGSIIGFYDTKPLNVILPEYGISPAIGASEQIYAGGKVQLGIKAAQKEVEIQEAQKVLSSSEVLLNIERSYWSIANLSDKLGIAIRYKEMLGAFLTDLNNSYDAGLSFKNDVLRAQVELNNAELNLIRLRDNLTLTKLSFAQMIGLGDSVSFELSDSLTGNFSMVNNNLSNEADSRPEIKILKTALEQQQIQVKVYQADYKPTISVSANGLSAIGKKGVNPENPNSNFMGAFYGLLNINVPIWDWGAIRHRIKAQRFRISAQQIQLEETKQQISLEVQQAYLKLKESVSRIELSDASLDQANENLRLSNDRYKAGTILSKDVLEAQNIWEQANSNVIDAKVEYKINVALLKKALGEKQ